MDVRPRPMIKNKLHAGPACVVPSGRYTKGISDVCIGTGTADRSADFVPRSALDHLRECLLYLGNAAIFGRKIG